MNQPSVTKTSYLKKIGFVSMVEAKFTDEKVFILFKMKKKVMT
jgi:hypothetical protein